MTLRIIRIFGEKVNHLYPASSGSHETALAWAGLEGAPALGRRSTICTQRSSGSQEVGIFGIFGEKGKNLRAAWFALPRADWAGPPPEGVRGQTAVAPQNLQQKVLCAPLRGALPTTHNCAAVFGLRLCRNWALWGGYQEGYNLPLRGLYQKGRNLALWARLKAGIRRACRPASEQPASRPSEHPHIRSPAAGPAGWGSEGPAAATPEGRIRSRNRSRNRRPYQNAGTPNIRTPAIRTPKFGQPNQKIRAAETPD